MKSADNIDAFVGVRIRQRRSELGISQEQLGAALGLTFQQIQKYETGRNRVGAGRLYRIAQLLSTPVHYFYDGLPEPETPVAQQELAEHTGETQAFLASPEGQTLSSAFRRITDTATRRHILELVTTIADGA